MRLVLRLPFEVLDALAGLALLLLEMIVGTAGKGLGVFEFAVEVVSVLSVPDLDMHQ